MNETQLTITGNLVDDPELRFTPGGQPAARFRIASSPRFYNKQANEWQDGESLFLTCHVWRQDAENVAESLTRGTRAIMTGRLRQRSYETKEGDKRTVYELEADEVGVSLRNATAKVTKASRTSAGNGGQRQGDADPGGQRPGERVQRRAAVLSPPGAQRRPVRLPRRAGRLAAARLAVPNRHG